MPLPTTDRTRTLVLLGLITAVAFLTFVQRFREPAAFFWDENYHVASAQKYLNGVFFMEQHPPLGKLLIAAGEAILDENALDNQFLGTDYAIDPPPGFSFAGYRLFPVLLAALTAPLLFLLLLYLTRSDLAAALLSSLYLFDNALIVHLRGAMLEPILLFFSMLTVLAFVLLAREEDRQRTLWWALLFGVAFACALTTKVVALVLVLLIPALAALKFGRWQWLLKHMGIALAAFVVVYVAVWHIHFARGVTINPALPDAGYYQASAGYKTAITNGRTTSLRWFPVMLRDSLRFVGHYNNGVPRLDLCKADENGSPWFFWPVGARAINYRWETPDGGYYRYLYLQVNPVVWWSAFLGILAALGLLLASYLLPLKESLKDRPMILIFTGLYFAYMVAIARIDRVMYLYHYFLPLLFSFCVLALVLQEIKRIGKFAVTEQKRILGLLCFAVLIFGAYEFYRPLSNYEPISDGAFQKRVWIDLWDLRCVHCVRESPLVSTNIP